MRLTLSALMAVTELVLVATSALAADNQRYLVQSGSLSVLGQQMPTFVLLDTATGRTWLLSCPANKEGAAGCSTTWSPLPFFTGQEKGGITVYTPPGWEFGQR